MKAKFLILVGVVLWAIMPMNAEAQEQKTEYRTEGLDTTEAFIRARSKMKTHREWLENRKIEEVFSFSGKIIQWHSNEDLIYDGFYLLTEDDTCLVRFEKTLGSRIRSIGHDVSLRGNIVKCSEDIKVINLVNIKGEGDIIYSNGSYNGFFFRSNPVDFQKGEGKIKEFVYSKKQNIVGYILENDVILHVSTYATEQLSDSIQIGTTIEYTGIERKIKDGEVAVGNYKNIHCQSITINGKQYLVM